MTEPAAGAPPEHFLFPTDEIPPLRPGPAEKIFCGAKEVGQKSEGPCRRWTDFPVAGVGRRAVEQREHGDFLPLFVELPRHFIRDVSAEAVTAEAIRSARLDRAKIG